MMLFKIISRACFLVLSFFSLPVFACDLDLPNISHETSGYNLSYQISSDPIELGEHFSIKIWICKDGQGVELDRLRVDALMPAHQHGMNYEVKLSLVSKGEFLAEGLLFHMPGNWQFVFDVFIDEEKYTFTQDYQLK